MTIASSRSPAWGQLGRRLFDHGFLTAFALVGLFIAVNHLEWKRSSCGDWVSNTGHGLS